MENNIGFMENYNLKLTNINKSCKIVHYHNLLYSLVGLKMEFSPRNWLLKNVFFTSDLGAQSDNCAPKNSSPK